MDHALTPDTLPTEIDAEITVRLPLDSETGSVRPLVRDGAIFATIRPTSPVEREWVYDEPYRAEWLGWHRGQPGGYGATPSAALEHLLKSGRM